MANQYFDNTNSFDAHTLARAEQVKAAFESVEAAFGKLPSPGELNQDRVAWGVDSGTADTYIVTLPHSTGIYVEGMTIRFKPTHGNTGASTVNVNGAGTVSILRASGDPVATDDIIAGMVLQITYTAGAFRISGSRGAAAAITPHTHPESEIVNLVSDLAAITSTAAALATTVSGKAAAADLTSEGAVRAAADTDLAASCVGLAAQDVILGNNIALKANTADLAAVATSGNYADLISTPATGFNTVGYAAVEITTDTYTATAADVEVIDNGETVTFQVNHVLHGTSSHTVVITMPASSSITSQWARFVYVQDPSQTGDVTIVPESGGTINGGTSAIKLGGPGALATIVVLSNSGSAPVMVAFGDTYSAFTVRGVATFSKPLALTAYTVGTAPSASPAGQVAYFSNGGGGNPMLAFSDGSNWKRVDTGANIS